MAQRRRGFGLGAVCTLVGSRVSRVTWRTSDSWQKTEVCHRVRPTHACL